MTNFLTISCRFCRGRGRVFLRRCTECAGTGEHKIFISPSGHERDSISQAVDELLEKR